MKDKFLELVSLRDAPLALVHSTLWLVALWVFQTPADERIVVCILAYTTLWASRLIVTNSVVFILNRLHRYALQVAHRLGVEVQDNAQTGMSARTRVLGTLFALAVISEILGISFSLMTPIGSAMGLSPLSLYFNVAAWILLALGALALAIFFTTSLIILAIANSLDDALRTPIDRIEQSQGWIRQLAV